MQTKWLEWAQNLSAIAQNGLTYCRDPYDRERYEQIRKIAAEIVSGYSDLGMVQLKQLLSSERGYATPKIDVRGAIFSENRILLVKERSDGLWTLPGGWADVNDSPAEAVEKEILEESGYEAKAVKIAAVYDRNKHGHPYHLYHTYKLFFLCEITGGKAGTICKSPLLETDGVDFFTENNLPPLSVDRVTAAQIKRMFEHYRDPGLATDFD